MPDTQLYLYQGEKPIEGCRKHLTRRGTLHGIIEDGVMDRCGSDNSVAATVCHDCAVKFGIENEIR